MATFKKKDSEAPQYARLNFRLDARIKQRAKEAASILGQSITDFTEMALAEKAQAVLAGHDRIILSERDFARFMEVLETPPAPTQKLREAAEEYKRICTGNPKETGDPHASSWIESLEE